VTQAKELIEAGLIHIDAEFADSYDLFESVILQGARALKLEPDEVPLVIAMTKEAAEAVEAALKQAIDRWDDNPRRSRYPGYKAHSAAIRVLNDIQFAMREAKL